MTAIDLPEVPAHVPVRRPSRRPSRRIDVGRVPVGDGAPISVRTMTTTSTADVDATLRQIAEVTAAGERAGLKRGWLDRPARVMKPVPYGLIRPGPARPIRREATTQAMGR
ncbi:flavodoxin-dependent (E)-4-hydroxy-3-methylbut-2-enyl-diphosphate synthase [Embleya sp. NPDC020630]|uniref:flavodoxin-dependent (E)-4-hydroxy-3-methylbut-2-enyl-diphosphate synthase n=1 Tax=Embleya sp. NPDC020630 TaxID=3363979 RepID=UPI0037AB7203